MPTDRRLPSIDILRTLAIVSMVQIHFIGYLSGYRPWPRWLPYALCGVPGVLAAPLFSFLLGVSLVISLERQRSRGRTERAIAARTLKRAALIFFGGFLYQFAIWGRESIFDWDILTLLGASLVLLVLLRRTSPITLWSLGLLVIVVSPWLRRWSDYADDWVYYLGRMEYEPDRTLTAAVTGFFVNGYFPIFPWLAFPLTGFAFGKWLMRGGRLRDVLVAGLLLILIGFAGWKLSHHFPWDSPWRGYFSWFSFYPLSTTELLASLGFVLAAFALLRLTVDRWASWPLAPLFLRYSSTSLAIYVFHHIVHVWPLRLAGEIAYGDQWYYYGDVVAPEWALLLAGLCLVACYPTMGLWIRLRQTLKEEMIMDTYRTFIAIPLPADVLAQLSAIQADLSRRVTDGSVRWVRPEGIHLTLKFLGDTPVAKLPAIEEALTVVARHAPPCPFIVEGLGCFPNTRRPRVVWVGVREETGRLAALRDAIEEAMAAFGYERERRKFSPHLTLGRVRRKVSRDDVAQVGAVVAGTEVGRLGEVAAARFAFIRSILKPTGAEYVTLREFALARRGA